MEDMRDPVPEASQMLKSAEARAARTNRLHLPHMQPLSALVEAMRTETGRCNHVRDFDPSDGGIAARCLFLLEAPGPRAVLSGFISRDNPDESAKNFFELNHEAGIQRQDTVLWNVVPWYIGSGAKIRAAVRADVELACPYLTRLLAVLPKLELVVLVGQKADMAKAEISRCVPFLKIVTMPHPSPLFVNRLPGNRARLLRALQEIAQLLASEGTKRLQDDGALLPQVSL